jgi:glycyl-tRNA synthetase beta chain
VSRFLLEIGCEEIPDWMIVPALNQLQDHFQTLLDQNGLGGKVTRVEATPRRLVLWADELVERQADSEELLLGPPKSAGAGAAGGFARKMGTTPDALGVHSTAKGEYFSFLKKQKGRETAEILGSALPDLVLKIQWPKTMYWTGKNGVRFIRPIRWLVALFDDRVVHFEIAGVSSGSFTFGHRSFGGDPVPVTIETFEQRLEDRGVVVSAARRRKRIETAIAGWGVQPDAALLETLVYITELPTPILGSFDPEYLRLPREVLSMVMRHHQKYFSVEDEGGGLAPKFAAVMNAAGDPDGLVRHGNERVLRARFNDASFFWEHDLARRLEDRLEDLKSVTFQAKLGSYYDKTQRVVRLTRELGGDEHAQRAALLSKCDLTTDMVKEFTDLQGVVGGLYARAQGEPEVVWRAVYEHYRPVSMEQAIPSTAQGQVMALADKLDTLRECFRVGLIPSGSKDPFALRRAAQGVVRILAEGSLGVALQESGPLRDFLADRVKYYFREVRGYKYDEVNAVLAAGWQDLPDVEKRLAALREVRPTENFEPLAASFKRIQNILRQAGISPAGSADPALLESGPETELAGEFERVKADARKSDYPQALRAIASLRPAIDLFFDKVLVNAPDPRVRTNRLTLLSNLLTEFSTIADFSEIVTDKA